MEQHIYTCPECGSPSIKYEKAAGLVLGDGTIKRDAECADCNWQGNLSATVGFATTEKVWGIESIADLLTQVITKHAAGPLFQALEHVGVMPTTLDDKGIATKGFVEGERQDGMEAHDKLVQELRAEVLKAALGGMISEGFAAAAEAHKRYCEVVGIKPQGIFADD